MLKEKDKLVLNLVVESYLKMGHPISSGTIAQRKPSAGSPATIRNIMARLEERGYLSQPHTSAGRVPTDKGLKSYVDGLLAESLDLHDEAPYLPDDFSLRSRDFNSLLVEVSRVLADRSDNLGFVISPHISRVSVHHIRFIRISDEKVMVILVAPYHMVLTEIVTARSPYTQAELDRASQYINQNFRGKTLFAVRDFLLRELPQYMMKYESMLNRLADLVRASVSPGEGESRIYLQGTSRLLSKAELFDTANLRSLFQNFEEKAGLAKLLSDFISLDKVKVLIGSEVNFPNVSDCSLVLSHYGTDSQVLGSLGIIGPKRIPYNKIIPLVESVARRLSRAIIAGGREVSL